MSFLFLQRPTPGNDSVETILLEMVVEHEGIIDDPGIVSTTHKLVYFSELKLCRGSLVYATTVLLHVYTVSTSLVNQARLVYKNLSHLGIGVDCNEPLFLINNIIIYIEGKVIISRPLLIAVEQQ